MRHIPTVLANSVLAAMLLSSAAAQTTIHNATSRFSDANGPYTAEQLASIKFPDLDGDGFADMCYIDTDGVYCALSFGTWHFSNFTRWATDFTLGTTDQSMWGTIQYADVNNDGKDDLCGRTYSGFVCLFSDGEANFNNQGTKALKFGGTVWQSPQYWKTIRLVDVNGDGKLDVCGRLDIGIVCETLDTSATVPAFAGWSLWGPQFSDAAGWGADASNWSTIQFADVNGDGLRDVCGRFKDGVWCAFNYGGKFDMFQHMESDFSDANGWNQPRYYSTIVLADVNGDFKADLCGRGTSGLICGLSEVLSSPSFVGTFAPAVVTTFSNANGWDQAYRYENMWMVRTNHDNKADICGRAYNGIVCAQSLAALTTTPAAGPQYGSTQLYISGFTDTQEGLPAAGTILTPLQWQMRIAYSANYWSTIQPVSHGFGRPVGFCGRQPAGIYCSD